MEAMARRFSESCRSRSSGHTNRQTKTYAGGREEEGGLLDLGHVNQLQAVGCDMCRNVAVGDDLQREAAAKAGSRGLQGGVRACREAGLGRGGREGGGAACSASSSLVCSLAAAVSTPPGAGPWGLCSEGC